MKKKNPLNNQRGIALLVTLFAIMILTFLAIEIGYNTQVELSVGVSQVDRLRAYYLAKSGIQISLLRINLYRTAMQRFGDKLGAQKHSLDVIWQFPFAWPPMIPEEGSSFDKATLAATVKESFIRRRQNRHQRLGFTFRKIAHLCSSPADSNTSK
jgi:general secretion pathway protein K